MIYLLFLGFEKKMDNRMQKMEIERLNAIQEKKEALQNAKILGNYDDKKDK